VVDGEGEKRLQYGGWGCLAYIPHIQTYECLQNVGHLALLFWLSLTPELTSPDVVSVVVCNSLGQYSSRKPLSLTGFPAGHRQPMTIIHCFLFPGKILSDILWVASDRGMHAAGRNLSPSVPEGTGWTNAKSKIHSEILAARSEFYRKSHSTIEANLTFGCFIESWINELSYVSSASSLYIA